MVKTYALLFFIGAIYFSNDAAEAKSNNCPSSAIQAGSQIWPAGKIPRGAVKTARHACGKRVRCTGAKGVGKGFVRRCRWLR